MDPLRSTTRQRAVPRFRQPRTRRRSRVRRPAVSTGLGERLEAGVQVQVAGLRLERLRQDAADPPLPGATAAADVDHDPPGQPAGQLPQAGIGGAGQVGQQGQRLVRVVLHQAGEGLLVELSHLGRDLLEALVAGQLATRRRPPGRLGHCLVRSRALPHEGELVAPVGAPASPWPPPSVRRPNTSPHSSVMISSEERVTPSRSRTRPDRAISAASRPTLGLDAGRPRSSGQAGRDRGGVDGAAHGGADPHLGVTARAPDELDHGRHPGLVECPRPWADRLLDDGGLVLRALVVDEQPAGPVVHGARDPGRADRVEEFIAATSRKPGAATTRPSRGTCSSASLITVMSTLSVSSGIRLISST